MLSNSGSEHDLLKKHTDTEPSLSSNNFDVGHPTLPTSEYDPKSKDIKIVQSWCFQLESTSIKNCHQTHYLFFFLSTNS